MRREKAIQWAVVVGAVVFWVVLGYLFGPSNVRDGLRAIVVLVMVLGVAFVVGGRLLTALRVKASDDESARTDPVHSPEARKVYNAIFAREDGQLTHGYVIGFICEGRKGYTPLPQFGKFTAYDEAKSKADELNAKTGLTSGQINRITNRWA
jgi:hypothetical protein